MTGDTVDEGADGPGDGERTSDGDGGAGPLESVERAFTCTVCGFAMVHEADPLQAEARGTCLDCGDWTVQTARLSDLVDAAGGIAGLLAGPTLTERQALAYLLREAVGLDRRTAAEAMETSASNVDNLHRRAREKISDARRVVTTLERVEGDDDATTESGPGPSPGSEAEPGSDRDPDPEYDPSRDR